METLTAPEPKMYRNSNLTVEEFNQLPIPDREALNRHCDWAERNPDKIAEVLRKAQPKEGQTVELNLDEEENETTADDEQTEEGHDFDALADETATIVTAEQEQIPVPLVATESVVYKTTNYDLFRILEQNRVVNQTHVRALIEKIKHKNLLPSKPMDVTREMEVIDGQHRLAAARELGIPIYYVFTDLGTSEIADVNTSARNWCGEDYLHFWMVQGNMDYRRLHDFMQAHPSLSFSNALMMMAKSQVGTADFRAGLWRAGDTANAEAVAALMERIRTETAFKQANASLFVKALHYCILNVDGFDPKKFMEKIHANPRALVLCGSQRMYIEMFAEIYNRSLAAKNRLTFF